MQLERTIQLKELATQQDFESALNLDKVVIYLLVDWSGPERASRYVVYKTLSDLEIKEILFSHCHCST